MTFEVRYPTFNVDSVDRVQIRRSGDPIAPPGECILCKGIIGVDGRVLIDFGKNIEFYGRVQFCNLCLDSVVRPLGFIDINSATYRLFLEDIQELKNAVEELQNKNSRLKDYERIFNDWYNSSSNNIDNTEPSSVAGDTASQAGIRQPDAGTREEFETSSEPNNSRARQSSAVDELDYEQGHPSLRNSDEFDFSGIANVDI